MLATNPVFHSRTKHIDVRHYFVRQIIESAALMLKHVPSEGMPADILTKALSKSKHTNCVKLLELAEVN